MEEYTIIETVPSAEDYNRLRQSVGWSTYQIEVIKQSLGHSLYCVCAVVNSQTVGMARVIGDAGMVYYIQDVIVEPAFQGQGLGDQLMDCLMAYIRANAHPNTIIGLMSAKGKEHFYERYGFTARPTDTLGCGMTLFWQAERPAS
jgi:GNAT superfamily N-acetyltransferase